MSTQLLHSAEEAFDLAIEERRAAAVTYRSFARQAATPEVKSVFDRLAADETAHFRSLVEKRRAAAGPLPPDVLAVVERRRAAKLPPGGIPDAEAAYHYAIRVQKKAHQFYALLGQVARSPDIRQAFQALANDELCRRLKLEAELNTRRSPKGFFRALFRLLTRR
jgi:rubrerythrin